jgi:hypothetical protein
MKIGFLYKFWYHFLSMESVVSTSYFSLLLILLLHRLKLTYHSLHYLKPEYRIKMQLMKYMKHTAPTLQRVSFKYHHLKYRQLKCTQRTEAFLHY